MILVKNILSFLNHKGWTIDKVSDSHYLLKPPSYIETAPRMRFHLVRETMEGTPFYLENMHVITRSIATLYDLNHETLEELFSKSPSQIKEYNEVLSGLLASP